MNNASLLNIGLILVLTSSALSGCATSDTLSPLSVPSTKSSSQTESSLSSVATPKPSSSSINLDGLKLNESCEQLLTQEELYKFNPNLSLDKSGNGSSTSVFGQISAAGGLRCLYKNLSSEDLFEIGKAQLTDNSVELLRQSLADAGNVAFQFEDEPGISYYLTKENGVILIQAISGNNWVVVQSLLFTEPRDAQDLIRGVLN